jgi:ABC-type glutathione transport system ATPase component
MVTSHTRIDTEVVLSVDDLRTHFTTRWGTVKAVDGISFDLRTARLWESWASQVAESL